MAVIAQLNRAATERFSRDFDDRVGPDHSGVLCSLGFAGRTTQTVSCGRFMMTHDNRGHCWCGPVSLLLVTSFLLAACAWPPQLPPTATATGELRATVTKAPVPTVEADPAKRTISGRARSRRCSRYDT